jgi:mRNA interferase HigB
VWVISTRRLREFWQRHPDAERRLRTWYQVVAAARWSSWDEVRQTFPAADLVGRLAIFNVGGNNYRVIARIEFGTHKTFIRYVLTHAEYSTDAWKHDPWF